MARRRMDRVGLLLLGLLVGFLLTVGGLYTWFMGARDRVVEDRVRVALGLPREAFELEDVAEDGTLTFVLRRVAFLGRGGDTLVSAPSARARLRVESLQRTTGPIEFDQVEILRPNLRLAQDTKGEWNVFQIMAVEASGQPVRTGQEQKGRPLAFRGVRIVDGRATILTPTTPPGGKLPGKFASLPVPEKRRVAGRWVAIRTVTGLDARLPLIRIGGNAGYRVEIASATARVTNPDTRIEALAGWLEDRGDQVLRFDIDAFRTPFSSFDGSGSIATGGASPRYDVALRAHPLDLRDLQGMGLPIPGAGTARFALDIQTRPDGLTRWALTDASLAILDSRAAGRLTALTRPGRETVFTDTRVTLSPLRLTDLEAMGFVEKMPFEGDVSGTIASTDQVGTETGGPLQLDLSARMVPRGTNGPPSSLALRGGVTYVPGSDAGLRFAGLRVVAEPLDLGTLRPLFVNGAPAALRGEVRGAATLSGSLQDLRVEGGELAYIVGDAPPTRLGGLTGEVHLGGAAPRWSLRANAEPLALATLTELFPALPFRSATLSGPIQLNGNGSNVDFNVELSGSAGGLTLRGAVAMGEVPSFDVSGRLSAFNVGGIVTSTPDAANGPLSGTLAARGTMKDFRFDVDLTQAGGRFVLGGRVRRPGDDPPQFDVAGRVENFRIGYLLGRPDLLPSPVSGPIRLSGGGRAPYRFDVDLAGEQGRFDLEGWYQPGGAGRFEVAGRIEGVNPQPFLPAGTRLEGGPVAGTVSARGTLRDLRFDVDLTQGGGRVVLGGTVVRPEGASPSFDVAGRVENFRIGLLLGRPGLLPNPVTGPIALKGGAGQPYTFDVDLRGRDGRIDLAGWFLPGDVPRYSVSGSVEGLNLSGLPGIPAAIPRTRLTATVAIEGQGTTPETLAGTYRVEVAPGSMIGGVPIERGIARVTARDGILYVDTVSFAARTARFEGGGQLGLTRPAPEPLRFSLQVPDLAQLRQILPGADTLPDLAGSIAASGLFRGTLSRPDIAANGEARGLRWGRWAAADLRFDGSGRKDESGSWIGNARLNGSGIELAFADQRFETLTVELNATPGLVSFGGRARRDAETEIAASGTIELDSTAVRGALLETLSLRIGGTDWQLADRARVAWTPEGGLAVENLLLRRTGGGTGYIAADGVLPPRGVADLRVHVEGVELADVRRLLPTLPDVTGRLMLDAVISGEVNDPRFTVTASVDSLRYGGIATDSLTLTAAYAGERMRVNGGAVLAGRRVLDFDATVPLRFTLGGIVPGFDPLEQGPLTALVRADSLPMALIAQALPQLEDDATGTIVALVQVSGTLDDPEVRGNARVVDGALTVTALGARWEDINGNLSLDGDLVRIDSLTARTGDDGRAYVDGTVRLDDPKRPLVYIRLNLDEFQVIDNPEVAELQAYSRVAISGRLPGAVVTGSVKIEDGNIYIPELGAATEQDIVDADVGQLGADTIDAPVTITQRLLSLFAPQDLEVEVGDRVWLKSNDANIQIGGRVGVSRGPGGGFLVTGDLEARRGTFDVGFGFFEREFDIVEGRVQFFGTADLNAALDITASHEVRAVDTDAPLTIFVHLGGTLQNPRLDFTTDQRTPIATSDIASLLLFGRRVEELGGLGGAFASEVLTQELFGNLLAAGIERGLISTGLVDYVRVRSSTAAAASGASGGAFGFDFLSAVTVELGKEVVDNVFVALQLIDFPSELKLGGALDWRVTRTLSVRAEYGPVRRDPLIRNSIDVKRQATVDVRWRYEYGRPKTDEPPPAPAATEEPKPGQPSTPTGQPPPEPPP